MRILIIVTDAGYGLLNKTDGWLEDCDNDAWTISVKQDLILLISQFQPPFGEDDQDEQIRLRECRNKTTQRVVDASRKVMDGRQTAFLAYHSHYVKPEIVREQIPQLVFRGIAQFSHEVNDSQEFVYPALCALVATPSALTFDNAIDAILAKQGKSRADCFASLQHRIITLFLPTLAALQNWHETYAEETEQPTLADVFHRAGQHLKAARPLLYERTGKPDSVERIVKESGLAEHEAWRLVQSLLAHRPSHSAMSSDQESLLWCTAFAEESSERKGQTSEWIQSFESWYDQLNNALENLRQEVQN